ncbi:MAG TPA: hypothetical protein VL175_07395 [Pirellulales bacterium]|jgi:hypothetical protein|nr:hypothetical protein [Pirellulales bacterium]
MNQRSFAISILQKARDALSQRLTERVVESEHDIQSDAEGESYLSEIETIYDQIGGRLAHLNAMLSNLPPEEPAVAPEVTASEIVYADLAAAYPTGLDLGTSASVPLLGLPAPAASEEAPAKLLVDSFRAIVAHVRTGDLATASRLIADVFDIRPSQARRGAAAFARQLVEFPDLACRIEELGFSIDGTNEYAAATLLGECFEFQAIEALTLVRALKGERGDTDLTR